MRQLNSVSAGGPAGAAVSRALANHLDLCESAVRERQRRLGPLVPAGTTRETGADGATRETGADVGPAPPPILNPVPGHPPMQFAREHHQMAVATSGRVGVMYPMHPGQPALEHASRGSTTVPAVVVTDSASNVLSRWALADVGWMYASDSVSAALVRLGYLTHYLRRGEIPELWYLDITFSPRRRADGSLLPKTKARAVDHTQRPRAGARLMSFAVADVPCSTICERGTDAFRRTTPSRGRATIGPPRPTSEGDITIWFRVQPGISNARLQEFIREEEAQSWRTSEHSAHPPRSAMPPQVLDRASIPVRDHIDDTMFTTSSSYQPYGRRAHPATASRHLQAHTAHDHRVSDFAPDREDDRRDGDNHDAGSRHGRDYRDAESRRHSRPCHSGSLEGDVDLAGFGVGPRQWADASRAEISEAGADAEFTAQLPEATADAEHAQPAERWHSRRQRRRHRLPPDGDNPMAMTMTLSTDTGARTVQFPPQDQRMKGSAPLRHFLPSRRARCGDTTGGHATIACARA